MFAAWGFGAPAVKWTHCKSTMQDTLVFGDNGPCPCDPKTFVGPILSVNGEDGPLAPYTSQTVQIGVGGLDFPYGAVLWIEFNHQTHIKNNPSEGRLHAVAYVNSNCVKEREEIAVALSKFIDVHAFGGCNANGRIKRRTSHIPRNKWSGNYHLFRKYDYVLAAEHGVRPGYVTEKPFMAAAGGAIPIYWGDAAVATKYLNPARLMVWNDALPARIASMPPQEKRAIQRLPAVNDAALEQAARAVFERLNATRKLNVVIANL